MVAGAVHRTEVDGVPVFWADGPGHAVGQLVFRVGQVDEPLPLRGTTHLIEHLALASVDLPHLPVDGSVGTTLTSFVAVGSAAEVSSFLTSVSAALAALPFARMANGIRILEAESARRDGSLVRIAMANRYGATGYGRPGFPELGLHGATPEGVDAWRRQWFTRANAVVWLNHEPPADLDLSALPAGARQPAPRPVPLASQPFPCWFRGATDKAMVLLPLEDTPVAHATMSIVGARLRRRLRHDEGRSYVVDAAVEGLSAQDAHGVIVADCLPEEAAAMLDAFRVELTKIALHGPTDDEVEDHRVRMHREAEDPSADAHEAERRALDELLGRPAEPDGASARLAAVDAVDAPAVASTLRRALDGAVWAAPGQVGIRDHRIHPITSASDVALTGTDLRRPEPVSARHPDRLVVAADGLSLCWASGRTITTTWDEVVAVQRWADGARTVWARDGVSTQVRAEEWTGGAQAITALDRMIPAEVTVAMTAPLGPATLQPVETDEPSREPTPASAARPVAPPVRSEPARAERRRGWLLLVVGAAGLIVLALFVAGEGEVRTVALTAALVLLLLSRLR